MNADAYCRRYHITWEQYLNEDPEILNIRNHIIQFETERGKIEELRNARDNGAAL